MMAGVKEEAVTYFVRVPISVAAPTEATETPSADTEAQTAGAVSDEERARVAAAIPLGGDTGGEQLTYRAGGGSAVAGATAVATDASGREVERRADGTTVRRVAAGATHTADDKVGRNDPCPCGSGQKYKRCHGA
jgi:preprotein translocase subunit SecA